MTHDKHPPPSAPTDAEPEMARQGDDERRDVALELEALLGRLDVRAMFEEMTGKYPTFPPIIDEMRGVEDKLFASMGVPREFLLGSTSTPITPEVLRVGLERMFRPETYEEMRERHRRTDEMTAWQLEAAERQDRVNLLSEWCGVVGITKPDEIRLAEHVLAGGDRDPALLDAISMRWDSILTKWDAKGWWDWGVSMRTGWFTDKGVVAIKRRLEETKRRMKMGSTQEYETELHSTEPEAVAATRSTIELLGGRLIEREGKFFLTGNTNPGHFVQWSALRQGYVRGARPVDSGGFTEEQRKAEARLFAELKEIDAKEGRA